MERPEITTIIFVVFSVALVAFFAPFNDQSVERTPETHVVEFTDRGFDPVALTIQEGDTVRFVDNASITMEVASDPHPTHTDYSNTTRGQHCGNSSIKAFDQCGPGEKFSFTFEKAGNWSYHNHRPFASGGKITVTE